MSEFFNIEGLGITASHRRKIKDGREYDKYFQKPERTDPMLSSAATTEQTVDLMENIIKKCAYQTEDFVKNEITGSSLKEKCQQIFDFAYSHIQYKLDKAGEEQLRSPNRAWADRRNGIDCDCFSIFVGCCLTNLKVPFAIRIIELSKKGYYQHVYAIALKSAAYANDPKKYLTSPSNYYTIDPVLDKFNTEAPRITKIADKIMIPVRFLNGLDEIQPEQVNDNFGSEFSGFEGFGNINDSLGMFHDKFMNSVKSHMVNTRRHITENPHKVSSIYDVPTLSGMLDYAIGNFDDPQLREISLAHLAMNDDAYLVSGVEGLTGLFGDDELGSLGKGGKFFTKIASGVKAVTNTVKKVADKAGDTKVGAAVKKVETKEIELAKKAGKAIIKYNPVSTAARAGFLIGMEVNIFGIAAQLKWGYATPEQIQRYGISNADYAKAKEALKKVENMFVNTLKGKSENLKKAILHNRGFSGLSGLGEPVTAATTATAAATFIAKAKDFIKGLKIVPKIQKAVKAAKDNKELLKIAKDKASGLINKKAATKIENNAVVPDPEPEVPASDEDQTPGQNPTDYNQPEPYNAPAPESSNSFEPSNSNQPNGQTPDTNKKSNMGLIIGLSLLGVGVAVMALSGKKKSKGLSGVQTETEDQDPISVETVSGLSGVKKAKSKTTIFNIK